ncbi:hypothetical protein [Rhizobium rhizogenes]|uniref:hypothetical protein n=1 Tax=Rhizobium rhizogenes TaxID=359 RepID=UPI0015719CA7|nr:hypothetical protein [Rhizobium rhizogenes]NTH46633.1 hypothetical protein [Rhizobium rhizogenes]NTH59499.1 hypothetical protein [Rhizobium rhizogenes]NTH90650.1 hypothetical protein [Rhizobium rhizogenes]NTI42826.1 hypothetical protein [Rhizobium rhizogenes]
MLLFRLIRPLRQSDQPTSDFRVAWERSKIFHEVVFTSIESLAILSALDLAIRKQISPLFIVAYCLAYLAIALYLLTFVTFFLNALADQYEWLKTRRGVFLWVVGTLSQVVSFTLPWLLSSVTSEFIARNFTI